MKHLNHLFKAIGFIVLAGCSALALAQQAGAIKLKMNAFKEVATKDKDGSTKIILEKISSAVPGDKVTYVTEYSNVSQSSVDAGAVISNPVPNNTHYVNNSATCQDCVITFSIDGAHFDALQNLKVSLGKGKTRPANHKDVKNVRWQLNQALAPQSSGQVSYKVQLNNDTLTKTQDVK